MEIRVAGRKEITDEPLMELWLEQTGKFVTLKGQDRHGKKHNIMVFTDRHVDRFVGISRDSGWPLTIKPGGTSGKIKMYGE